MKKEFELRKEYHELIELNNENIENKTNDSPGNYILFKIKDKNLIPMRCGRSDTSLKARLKSYIGKYDYFVAHHSNSAISAFMFECEDWHSYAFPDNSIHPDRPRGKNWKCPIDYCNALD